MKRTGFFSFTSAAVPVWSDITFIPLCLYCESILFSSIKRKRNVILKSTWIYVDTHLGLGKKSNIEIHVGPHQGALVSHAEVQAKEGLRGENLSRQGITYLHTRVWKWRSLVISWDGSVQLIWTPDPSILVRSEGSGVD